MTHTGSRLWSLTTSPVTGARARLLADTGCWLRILACLLASLAASGMAAVHAQALTHFYCYAPDPASGVIYTSPTLPVGPPAERAGYGDAWVKSLRERGILRSEVQAYCVMRATADAIAQARIRLLQEPCPECQGASERRDLSWPGKEGARLGPAGSGPPPGPPAPPLRDGVSRKAQATAVVTTAARDPVVVILGNVVSGKLIRMSYRMDIVAAAWNEARRIRPDGWEQLLVSHKEGYGAALCLPTPAGVRFFVAHGARSQAEAVREAQDRANAALAALKVADKPVACAAPWLVEPGRTDTLEPEDPDLVDDLIDDARKAIRDWVACPPARDRNASDPPAGDARDCAKPAGRPVGGVRG